MEGREVGRWKIIKMIHVLLFKILLLIPLIKHTKSIPCFFEYVDPIFKILKKGSADYRTFTAHAFFTNFDFRVLDLQEVYNLEK